MRLNVCVFVLTYMCRESWDALDETLRDVPKDAPLMTYCTGTYNINSFYAAEVPVVHALLCYFMTV